MTSNAEPKTEEEEQWNSILAPLSDDALIGMMENVVLKSDENQGEFANGGGNMDVGVFDSSGSLPLRPYAGNCPHYVRTGTCKFGLNCRYNHPLKTTQQFLGGRHSDSDNFGKIECKYFSIVGGCKYGNFCRYRHSGEGSRDAAPELNYLGLPIRPGEKECQYYLRNGYCGYGSRCFYHHPDLASVAGKESSNSMDEKFGKLTRGVSENHNGGSPHLGSLESYQALSSLHKLSDNIGPNSENQSSQWMGRESEWNGYETSSWFHQSWNSYSSPIANDSVRKTDVSIQVDDFPERPGEPECDYFMKTGNCKFKSACRFHHPENRISKPDECVLNENGLPLRPGRSICWHYERYGFCMAGPACLFDHPSSHG